MNIYLSNETNFERNGVGFLNDIISAKVTETLNGDYILDLEYPVNGLLSEYLVEDNIIKSNVGNDNYQLFRIKKVTKDFSTIKIYAIHISYDLLDNMLLNVAPTNQPCASFGQWILDNTAIKNKFTFESDITNTASARYVRRNPIEAILGNDNNSMVNLFGGELERDNFKFKMLSSRGSNSGVKLMFGKNITDIKITIDITSLYTRLIPLGYDGLMLPEIYVDSPLINDYYTPKISKVEFSDIKYDPEDENAFHNVEDAYQALRNACKELFNQGLDKPNINIKIDWLELSKVEEYKRMYYNLEKVRLGDIITANILGLDYTTKVTKTIYNVLTDSIDKFEIGTLQRTISNTINNTQKEVENINVSSILKSATENASNLITNAMGGYVYKTQSELYIMDTDNPETAQKVWRWNINGLGYSSNGINGDYEVAMTMDGAINASLITTGKLNTNMIEGYENLLLQVKKIEDIEVEVIVDKQANGNPIIVRDAGPYKLESTSIDGESYQETTEGNQLVDFGTFKGYDSMQVTFENDVITLIGDGSSPYHSAGIYITDLVKTNAGKTLYLDYEKLEYATTPNGTIAQLNVVYNDGTATLYKPLIASNGTKVSWVIPNDVSNISSVGFSLYTSNNSIAMANTIEITKPMLQFGTAKKEYEKYTGGKPSPSPDFPSEIQNVKGGEIEGLNGRWLEVKSIGRNMFDVPISIANNGTSVTATLNENKTGIIINGTNTTSNTELRLLAGWSSKVIKKRLHKGIYTIHSSVKNILIEEITITNGSTYYGAFSKDGSITFTLNEDGWGISSIKLQVPKNIQFNNVEVNIMLQEGSLTDYEPYKETTALIDLNNYNLLSNSPNDWVQGATEAVGNAYQTTRIKTKDYIKVNSNDKYKISLTNSKYCFINIDLYDANKTYIDNYYNIVSNNINGTQEMVLTFPSTTKYVKPIIRNVDNVSVITPEEITDINPTLYDCVNPYHELCAIGDIKDTFKDGILTQRIDKVVLNGSENITYASTYPRFVVHAIVPQYNDNNRHPIKSNYFHYLPSGTEDGGAFTYYKDIYLYDYRYTDVDSFKSHLQELYNAGTPVTVYYELATPIEHTLNYEVLEMHEGYNNITTNDDLEPNMEITYLTDSKLNARYASKADLQITAESITSEINQTLENEYATIEQANTIEQKITDTENEILLEVGKKVTKEDYNTDKENLQNEIDSKVSDDEFTKAQIIAKINDTTSEVQINADNINLNGAVTANENFKINEDGSMEAKAGTFGAWKIDDKGNIYADKTIGDVIYRTYIQQANADDGAETWAFSTQVSTDGGKSFTGQFVIKSNGEVISNNNIKTNGILIANDDIMANKDVYVDGGVFVYGDNYKYEYDIDKIIPVQYATGASGDISVPTSTNKSLVTVELSAGRYIILTQFGFSANANGMRSVNVSLTDNSADANIRLGASPSSVTRIRHVHFLNLTETRAVYFNVYQNSGSTLTCTANFYIYRIQ